MSPSERHAHEPDPPTPSAASKLGNRWDRAPKWVRSVGLLLVIAFAFYLPFLNILPFAYIRTDLTRRGSDWASVLFLIVVYMIAAVGLNVVIGFAGLLDLGYVGFYALGAYSVALFGSPSSPVVEAIADAFRPVRRAGRSRSSMCIPIAIAMALTAGVILGAPTLRLRGDYLAIVTLGFGEIIRITARNLDPVTGGAAGITGVPVPPGPEIDGRSFFNTIDAERWYWLALVILIILIVFWPVAWSTAGSVVPGWPSARTRTRPRSWASRRFKFKLWAFAIGASVGGIAGLLFGSKQQYVEPNAFMLNLSFLFVAMVVIGGSGNIVGVLARCLPAHLPARAVP